MKNAKTMFEELGYELSSSPHNDLYLFFRKKRRKNVFYQITFSYPGKWVEKRDDDFVPQQITMQELQAINQMCKELGWLE